MALRPCPLPFRLERQTMDNKALQKIAQEMRARMTTKLGEYPKEPVCGAELIKWADRIEAAMTPNIRQRALHRKKNPPKKRKLPPHQYCLKLRVPYEPEIRIEPAQKPRLIWHNGHWSLYRSKWKSQFRGPEIYASAITGTTIREVTRRVHTQRDGYRFGAFGETHRSWLAERFSVFPDFESNGRRESDPRTDRDGYWSFQTRLR